MKFFLLVVLMCVVFPVSSAEPRLISITGSSEFSVAADIINIDFSIDNQSEVDLAKGNEKVNGIAQLIIGKLVELGVSEKDIHSPSFNFENDRDYDDESECPGDYYPYVSRRMSVKLKDIDKYTDVINLLLENGATSIDDIDSEVSNFDQHSNEAMTLAIQDAKKQAKFYVESFGGKLGKVHRIGKKMSDYNRWSNTEEIVVTGTRSRLQVKPYKFRPSPVTVDATIYVEFEIE